MQYWVGPDGQPMYIYVAFLPTRSPELNPIELLFNVLVQRLKRECLSDVRKGQLAKTFAENDFAEMSHADTSTLLQGLVLLRIK